MGNHPATMVDQPGACLFHYRASVIEVHDGDTCTLDIDLGMSCWRRHEKVRLARIDAPELTGASAARGRRARELLKKLVLGKAVLLQTIKDRREKYGRYLGELWVEQEEGPALNASDALVEARLARYVRY